MGAPTGDVAFDTEVIKLLLQVAWADDQVAARERQLIFSLARVWSVPEAELKVLMERLDLGEPLPQPNLALLKTNPNAVLETARALVLTDGSVAEEETAMLTQISQLLGVG